MPKNTITIVVTGSGEARDPEWMVPVEGHRPFICRATNPKAAIAKARDFGLCGNIGTVVKVGD